MADPSTYRPAVGSIPESPGVYRFRDPSGRVIYVGKAKSLRQRLNSYFADVAGLHPRTRQMVTTASAVDWTVVGTEVEALQLEYNWIKEFDPRFNVRYRDDKSYPSLAVTLNEEFPRLQVMRGPKKKGVRYFGPYAHAWAIRETLDTLTRVFPARTCSNGVFKRAGQIGRPCLLGYIGKCSAPCVGRVTAEEHREIVDDFCDFMAGKTEQMIKRLEREMAAASEALEYEKAARLRDDLGALRRALEKQAVVLGDGTDADVVAFAQDELEAAVQVFHVRGGRVRGQRGWIVDKVEAVTTGELVEQFLLQVYGGVDEQTGVGEAGEAVPREVLVPELPEDADVYTELLEELRGGKVSLRVPQRGDKRNLMETVERNAKEAFARHRVKSGQRPHRPLARPGRAAGGPRPARRPAAHRVHRRLARPGHQRRGQHGRVRGRPGQEVRLPPLLRRPGHRRHRRHGRGRAPPLRPPPQGRGGPPRRAGRSRPRRAGRAGSPTRRTSWWSTAAPPGRRGQPVARRSSASSTSPSAAWPSAWRRCGCPATPTR